jgi:pimeloyl-ACP methyl ester carboxylesterase
MVALLDALLCIPRVIFKLLGHDWGGTLVWNMAMHYSDRIIDALQCGSTVQTTPFLKPWRKAVSLKTRIVPQNEKLMKNSSSSLFGGTLGTQLLGAGG